MKNMETLHTLRLYDADFITKLALLMEREQKSYRNKNEFLTAMLKEGYAAVTAAKRTGCADAANNKKSAQCAVSESDNEIYALLLEMNRFMTLQLKAISLYQEIQQKLLSSIYKTMLSLAGGEKVIISKIESGFYDDLPTRFERIIFNLKKELGVL